MPPVVSTLQKQRITGGNMTFVDNTNTILGVSDGNTLKIIGGDLAASTAAVNGSAIIDWTGFGDAGISQLISGNRYFAFTLQAEHVKNGSLKVYNFNKIRASMVLKLDTGETWNGTGIISSVVKQSKQNQKPGHVPLVVNGHFTAFSST